MMVSANLWLSVGLLLAAGLYQWSPLKHSCLQHCRSPLGFLSLHWREGYLGALRLGLFHGGYCIGCCWLLMALLFVSGVMSLQWIFLLSVLVLAEKVLPVGVWSTRGIGVLLVLLAVSLPLSTL
jgi:predicted metal-binding membrane protein